MRKNSEKKQEYRKRSNTRKLIIITKHSKIIGRIEERRTEKKGVGQECMKIYEREQCLIKVQKNAEV